MSEVRELQIRCEADWPAGTVVNVFEDRGTGTMDLGYRLNGRPIDCYPGVVPENGLGQAPLGRTPLGSGVPGGLLGHEDLGAEALGVSRPRVSVFLPLPYVEGQRLIAAVPADLAGNQPVGAPTEFAHELDMEPPGAYNLAYESFDAGTDRFTFSFALHRE